MSCKTMPARASIDALESRLLFSAGDPDSQFGGGDGQVLTALTQRPDPSFLEDISTASVRQPDGKLLVAGVATHTRGRVPDESELAALVRYTDDGSPDATFGVGGTLVPAFAANRPSRLSDVALSGGDDGQIVITGRLAKSTANTRNRDYDVVVSRLNSNGQPDPAFGDGGTGMKIIDLQPKGDDATGPMVVLPDGRVIVAAVGGGGRSSLALVALTNDGQRDTGFGTDGIARLSTASKSRGNVPTAIRVDGQGRVVVVGVTAASGRSPGERGRFFAARFTSAGVPDESFGLHGFAGLKQIDGKLRDAPLDFTFEADPTNPAAQVLVLAGPSQTGRLDFNFAVARIADNGAPLGVVSQPAPANVVMTGVAFQSDGKILAIGVGKRNVDGVNRELALARFNSDGSLDSSFAPSSATAGAYITKVPELTTFADIALGSNRIAAVGTIESQPVKGALRVFDVLNFENDIER